MFENLLQRWKYRQALKAWDKSLLGKMLAAHTQQYFQYPRLANFRGESKEKIVKDFYQTVFSLSQAENPFLAMREKLASYAVAYANLQVLCLTEEEKAVGQFADCAYISGTLHREIDKAVNHVDELREFKWKHPEATNDDLISFCNTRSLLLLYYLNGFNYVRTDFDDMDEQKDWLQPFIKAMLIWHEDLLRKDMSLPSLFANDLDSLKYSTFMNLVINGHKNPYFEWDKRWMGENA